MGCHTWCFKKVERTIEEARRLWIEQQMGIIASWQKMIDDPTDHCRVAYEWSQEFVEKQMLVYKRQLQMVKKGLLNVAVFNDQPEHCIYIQDKGFYVEEGTHDPFRIYGYPDDKLFSYEECLVCIRKYEITKNTTVELWRDGDTLKEFWDRNPDGMICFG